MYVSMLLIAWMGAAAVREAAVLLEAEGVAVDYTYMPEETE